MVQNRWFDRLPDARVGMGGGRRSRARLGENDWVWFAGKAERIFFQPEKPHFVWVLFIIMMNALRGDLCLCDEPRFDTRNINIPSRLRH